MQKKMVLRINKLRSFLGTGGGEVAKPFASVLKSDTKEHSGLNCAASFVYYNEGTKKTAWTN
jgi:hypothetical protein